MERHMTDPSQHIQDIKSRAEKAALHPPSLLEQVYHDRAWLLSQLDASLSRERALREALVEAQKPRASKQCPNCGDWVHPGDCNHSSSTRQSTLYGVCKKCADRHAEFGAALQGKG